MRLAGYCRVSTDTSDQLNSLQAQKRFFEEYAAGSNHSLVGVYADEGISGTKTRNRKEFLRLMRDARHGLFEMVVVKDISRFARNTVDLLNSTRQLKALNIETFFLTANMTVLGNSEFVLTIFGALAQEESANTSKRVKFGKQSNAEKGRVPNIVYGYDKTKGVYFSLQINEDEAAVVRRIFDMYIRDGCGAAKISAILNAEGLRTKRDSAWSQNGVSRILKNELYTGKIINGKQEVSDFLTGVRKSKSETDWKIVDRPDLRIIDPDVFRQAQEVLAGRHHAFSVNHERQSNRHLFSTLMKCADCGYSFRRTVHTYRNTYMRWVCSGRNAKGAGSCQNRTVIDEAALVESLRQYFAGILGRKPSIIRHAAKEYLNIRKAADGDRHDARLRDKLSKLRRTRRKYLDMYADDLISREELHEKLSGTNAGIEAAENELNLTFRGIGAADRLEDIVARTFKAAEDIVSMETLTNSQLKLIIRKILVTNDGGCDVFLQTFGESFPVTHIRT
ncbi:MAG: recombinase family protein [Defluviitaleaceae bacterium]|nr:recombinase family protein [Defluviitaleaceae bacterium]